MQHRAEAGVAPPAVEEGFGRPHRLAVAVVDLVAEDLLAAPLQGGLGGRLGGLEAHLDGQHPEPGDVSGPGFDLVGDGVGEHLVAATDSQHRTPGRVPFGDHSVEPAAAQPGQVADGRAGAGQHEQVGVPGPRGVVGDQHVDARGVRQRLHIGGVRDAREPDHRHPQHRAAGRRQLGAPPVDLQRVLAVEPNPAQPGQDAEVLQAGAGTQLGQPGGEEGLVTAELVDHVTGQQRPVGVVDQPPGAEDAGQHPAAVDVADDHHRQAEFPCQPQVDIVAGTQVDLGW